MALGHNLAYLLLFPLGSSFAHAHKCAAFHRHYEIPWQATDRGISLSGVHGLQSLELSHRKDQKSVKPDVKVNSTVVKESF